MSAARSAVALLAALVVLAPASRAQEPGEQLCGDCHTTGKIPHEHTKAELDQEKDCIYCTTFMEKDKEALGLDWMPCPKCRTPSMQARAKSEFDAEMTTRRTWIEERRKRVDALVGHPCWHLRTEHFELTWDVQQWKVGQHIYDAHTMLHIWADRFESLYAEIQKLHGVDDHDMGKGGGRTRFEVMMFEGEKSALTLRPRILGGTSHAVFGPVAEIQIDWIDKKKQRDDDEFAQYMTHHVAHLIYHDMDRDAKWLHEKYGWMQEGLGHFWEMRKYGAPRTYCSREAGADLNWKGKNWEAAIKRAVLAGEAIAFADSCGKAADTLTPQEHVYAWSWVDYLIWLDPTKLPKMLGMMKSNEQPPVRECLLESYGITMGQFDEGWQQFVKDVYSTAPTKGPTIRAPKGADPKAKGAPPSKDDGG